MSLRLAFMGTPDFAVPALTEIVGQGHDVAAVYTRAPRPAGRGMAERKSPVHETAERFGLPVHTPASLKSPEEQAAFAALDLEVAVVVAYGLILPQAILEAPRSGCLNLHASLLPRWRGAAPINRAIMAGDAETGVTVMRMDAGLDTGPVAMAERVPIGPDMTAGELHDRLARLGADLMARALAALAKGALDTRPQAAEGVTWAAKIANAETRIDWSCPAAEVHNRIRGLSPRPGVWCEMEIGGKAERVKVLRSALADQVQPPPELIPPLPVGERAARLGEPKANLDERGEGARTPAPGTVLYDLAIACGSGAVRLLELQRAGGKPLAAGDFLRGLHTRPERLG